MSITELVSTIHLKDSITFTLNTEFLNHNFEIVKQCLTRIKDLQTNLDRYKATTERLEHRLEDVERNVAHNSEEIGQHTAKIKEFNNSIGDQFMKKMYGIEEKTRNMFDFDETVRRLQNLDKFLLINTFKESRQQIETDIQKLWKIKDEFQRYVPQSSLDDFKREQMHLFYQKQESIDKAKNQIQVLEQTIEKLSENVSSLAKQLNQNNTMIKEINFAQMIEKIKKLKDQNESKLSEFGLKLKKKVGANDLFTFERNMVEKLDSILGSHQSNKAEKSQTKQALLFLLNKITELEAYLMEKLPEEEKDALFSAKKWQCASCTKDLGKYEGKLGQYRPWSVFPCKDPDPEKSGGFGYLNYIDKMAYKKGYDLEEQNLQRLNKTFNQSKQTPRKLSSTRASNLISNFGTEQKKSSLKQAYFREIASERAQKTASKQFRVLKKEAKQAAEQAKVPDEVQKK